jgi:error-prone DNA polymerase
MSRSSWSDLDAPPRLGLTGECPDSGRMTGNTETIHVACSFRTSSSARNPIRIRGTRRAGIGRSRATRRVFESKGTLLARIGALNQLDGITHRRDALWQVERAGKLEGPLLRQRSEWLGDDSEALPLRQMNTEERLVADYAGTGLTIGKHPMYFGRSELRRRNVLSAEELRTSKDGDLVRTAGYVIVRQRPGTANVIVTPDLYDRDRLLVTRSKFLLVEGPLQNQDGVIHVKALRLLTLSDGALELQSHDFH